MRRIVWSVYPSNQRVNTSYRNCQTVSELLRVPFVEDEISLMAARLEDGCEYPDVLFANEVNLLFCSWRKVYMDLVRNTPKVIWIRTNYNDYWKIDKRLTKESDEVWTSIHYMVYEEKRPNYFFLDWNKFAADPRLRREWEPTEDGVFYYGRYRPDRVDYFKKYFQTDRYKINIAATSPEMGEFVYLAHGFGVDVFAKRDLKRWPKADPQRFNFFEATLYLQDKWMQEHDCRVSRRFYECINTGLPTAIDLDTVPSFVKQGIPIDQDWIVDSDKDLAEFLTSNRRIRNEQRARIPLDQYFHEIKRDFFRLIDQRNIVNI